VALDIYMRRKSKKCLKHDHQNKTNNPPNAC
jgi:hypothetical protein